MTGRTRFFLIALAAVAGAHLLDRVAFEYLRLDGIYGEDWGRLLRVMGFLPLWLMVGLAVVIEERANRRSLLRSRGALLFWSATLGGIAAELLKLVFRRLRPGEHGLYDFRPFAERTFSTGGLALPSSHALVAFGAAALLARAFPRARWIWWSLAWGCGLSRVAAGAHFLSDIVVAAVIGWLIGRWVWSWRIREHPRGIPQPA
ncbi:MAG TPA: phosphatase PAP2 family protein [Longimicrobiales bacterium]|nr:phosphatase PAP2 family protein [Longimicrobiales bacterium]